MEEEIKEDNFYEDDIENLTKPTQFFTQIQFNQEKLKKEEKTENCVEEEDKENIQEIKIENKEEKKNPLNQKIF
jgi:hypothetical protein